MGEKVKSESVSCSIMSDSLWPHYSPPSSSLSMEFSRQELLQWVAIPFSSRSSQPRDRTQVLQADLEGRFLTIWTTRKAPNIMGKSWGKKSSKSNNRASVIQIVAYVQTRTLCIHSHKWERLLVGEIFTGSDKLKRLNCKKKKKSRV